MKKLQLLLCILVTGTLCAQPRIQSNEAFRKSGQSFEQLANEYADKMDSPAMLQLGSSVETIVKDALAGIGKTNYMLGLSVYVNESGKIDLVLYTIQAEPATRDTLQKILESDLPYRLQDWQLNGMEGKKLAFWKMIRQGQPPVFRQNRTGDSLLSSLEDARTFMDTLKIKALHFHQLDLKEMPYALIYRFPNLEMLDVHSNQLTRLQLDMSRLPRLKQIDLHNNRLHQDSIRLTKNRTLKILNLHSNQLTDVPDAARTSQRLESLWMGGNQNLVLTNRSFRKLRSVKDLNLYRCGLGTLPRGVRKLRNLEVLDLYYNAFTELPGSITRLRKLTHLAISNNELKELPQKINRLKRMQVLYAHHNHLSTLPSRMARLKKLQLLDLGYNWYSVFPREVVLLSSLRELDFSGNNFTTFPAPLSQMPYLEKLHLRGNPFLQLDQKQAYLPYIQKMEKNPTEVFY